MSRTAQKARLLADAERRINDALWGLDVYEDGEETFAQIIAPVDVEDPTEPDDWAFWRGLGVGLCISGCIWIAAIGGVWAWAKGVM